MICPIYTRQDLDIRKNHEQVRLTSSHEVYYLDIIGVGIQIARQIAAKKFLETDADYLFFVDDDVKFMSLAENPIDLLINLGKDIVGGIYVYKKPPYLPAFRPLDLQKQFEENGEFPKDYKFKIPDEPFEVEWLAGGCTMIKREVIEKIAETHPHPFCSCVYRGEFLSEDFAFCKRARDLGFEIWAEPLIELGHLGNYYYQLNDYVAI